MQNGLWTLSNHRYWADVLSPLICVAFSRFEYQVFYSWITDRVELVPHWKDDDAVFAVLDTLCRERQIGKVAPRGAFWNHEGVSFLSTVYGIGLVWHPDKFSNFRIDICQWVPFNVRPVDLNKSVPYGLDTSSLRS